MINHVIQKTFSIVAEIDKLRINNYQDHRLEPISNSRLIYDFGYGYQSNYRNNLSTNEHVRVDEINENFVYVFNDQCYKNDDNNYLISTIIAGAIYFKRLRPVEDNQC